MQMEGHYVSLKQMVVCKSVIRMRAGGLEDIQHAGAGDVPHLRTELLPVKDHQVLETVCA